MQFQSSKVTLNLYVMSWQKLLGMRLQFLPRPVVWGGGGLTLRGYTVHILECWPNTTSAWAGWSRFDIPVDRYGGVHSLLRCTSRTLGLLPATRLASREILIEQNIKKWTGPALCVLCGLTTFREVNLYPRIIVHTRAPTLCLLFRDIWSHPLCYFWRDFSFFLEINKENFCLTTLDFENETARTESP
jgi:hypothetical protein